MKGFIMACLFLSACAVPLTNGDRLTTNNRVAIIDSWGVDVVNEGRTGTDHKAVSVVVANPYQQDVVVFVVCEYKEDGEMFGVSDSVKIEAGMKRTIMVRGLLRDGGEYTIRCVIHGK